LEYGSRLKTSFLKTAQEPNLAEMRRSGAASLTGIKESIPGLGAEATELAPELYRSN
jgi:hypothetical protein